MRDEKQYRKKRGGQRNIKSAKDCGEWPEKRKK